MADKKQNKANYRKLCEPFESLAAAQRGKVQK